MKINCKNCADFSLTMGRFKQLKAQKLKKAFISGPEQAFLLVKNSIENSWYFCYCLLFLTTHGISDIFKVFEFC
jgi:hypothetical protein